MAKTLEPGLEKILRDFRIRPRQVKRSGNIYKIDTGDYQFALKEVKTHLKVDLFRLFQWLNSRGFVQHLPLVPDRYGNYVKWFEGKYYYLMPWIKEMAISQEEKKKQMFSELARLHLLTVQTIPVTEEVVHIHYDALQTRWQQEETFLLQFLERCERKWYMSPFEWRYVFNFHEIMSDYRVALDCLRRWRDVILDSKRSRTCLIHGQLHLNHYLIDERNVGYFINFEKSRIASPVMDLLLYLTRSLHTYPEPEGDEFFLLKCYQEIFSLTETEILLLQSYLAHPGAIIAIVNDYEKKQVTNHEWKYTKKIERFYWAFKNRERLIRKMAEEREEK